MTTIDPEVRMLLHEVVNDPTSALTRVPERGFGSWLSRTSPITASALSSKRDAHILRVLREEAAFLAYQACQRACLAAMPDEICQKLTPDLEISPLEPGELQTRVERVGSLSPHGVITPDAQKAFSCEAEYAVKLATLSMSLQPRDETRIMLGIAWCSESRLALARECFAAVLSGRPMELNHVLAFSELGVVALSSGQTAEARNHYCRALDDGHPLMITLCGRLYTALLLGERYAFMETARALGDFAPVGHPMVVECRSKLAYIVTSIAPPSAAARELLRVLWDALPPPAQELLWPIPRTQSLQS
jgi:hypothetical protein